MLEPTWEPAFLQNLVGAEKLGRVNLLFNLNMENGALYVRVEAAKGLPVKFVGHPEDSIFCRVALLPTGKPDLDRVAKLLFNPKEGPKIKSTACRGRTTLHCPASEIDFSEEFQFNVSEFLASRARTDFRLHIALVGTRPGMAFSGSNVFGCMSISLGEMVLNATPVEDEQTGRWVERSMTRTRWFWLFTPRVGLTFNEPVRMIKMESAPAATGFNDIDEQLTIEVAGRDGFMPNEMINDVYTWVPQRYAGSHTYKGNENNLRLYYLPGRSVWAIGAHVGNLLPFAYATGSADQPPDTVSAPWLVYSAELDAITSTIDSNEASQGAYQEDFEVYCAPSDGKKRAPRSFIVSSGQDTQGGEGQPDVVVVVDKNAGSRPGKLGLRYAFVPGFGHQIAAVQPDGAAAATDQIVAGMAIIAVNGIDVRNSKACTALIKEASESVELTLSRPAGALPPGSPPGPPRSKMSVSVDKSTGNKPGSLGVRFNPIPGTGLEIIGVVPGASGDITGQIALGQVVISINGIDVRSLGMAGVLPLLKQDPIAMLEIIGPVNVAPPGYNQVVTKRVSVDKRTGSKRGSLGIRFRPTQGVGLMVVELVPGGSSELSGAIFLGDVVKSINGIDVTNMEMPDVMPILSSSDVSELLVDGAPVPPHPAAASTPMPASLPQMLTTKSIKVNKQTGDASGSLGIKFGPTLGTGLRVNGITEGKSAALTGQIFEGDVIESINGVDVRSMEMADVMPILGQSDVVEFGITVAPAPTAPAVSDDAGSRRLPEALLAVTSMGVGTQASPPPAVTSMAVETQAPLPNERDVVVNRNMSKQGHSLGVAFEFHPSGDGTCEIGNVKPGFAVDVQGEIKPGTIFTALNGVGIIGMAKPNIVALLRQQDEVTFRIREAKQPVDHVTPNQSTDEETAAKFKL